MNAVLNDIFRAIHEGRWLQIEYRNKEEQITKYWIGIQNLNVRNRTLSADGLHLGKMTITRLDWIKIDSILSSRIVEGSYCPVNEKLVQDIYLYPEKYASVFEHSVNLKILTYLEMCHRMDTIPYTKDYALIHYLDRDQVSGRELSLTPEQFQQIVRNFQYQIDGDKEEKKKLHLRQLAMNVLSIHTEKGLYVLAYRRVNLDVKMQSLKPEEEITVCTEFSLDGTVQSVQAFSGCRRL